MRDEKKTARQKQIAEAAYDVLAEKGYAGASMLSIAKKAKASNETLYRWYGNKQGLFRDLVAQNAELVAEQLEEELAKAEHSLQVLEVVGERLLAMLLSPRAVALNRAAAADAEVSGELGQALAEAGRDRVFPLLVQLLEKLKAEDYLAFDHVGEAAELYVALLVGDMQIRRVTGVLAEPSAEDVQRRSRRAAERFIGIYAGKVR
ncbi:transcriptional regulator, TetR family [Pseudovibrio denitrificans]|uniref:Transcriptional regulator, TetR family n=2 Tax=Pseudovibrio denitrificans TaxID=258256 RepID=A0A1I7DPR0_9HYPH|nr:TetR/AcrR family transcriptional regulator [Pseudovibrio denitrificans]SFU13614.1 transcriptional regulator, TetR family [Pseudovibrio denitrificans]